MSQSTISKKVIHVTAEAGTQIGWFIKECAVLALEESCEVHAVFNDKEYTIDPLILLADLLKTEKPKP